MIGPMMKNEAERGVVGIYDGHNGDAPRITEQCEVWAGENYGVHEHKVNQGNSLVVHLSEVATSGRDSADSAVAVALLRDRAAAPDSARPEPRRALTTAASPRVAAPPPVDLDSGHITTTSARAGWL